MNGSKKLNSVTLLILLYVFSDFANSGELHNIDFNDLLSDKGVQFHTQFSQPEQTIGVESMAWRTDGFSSWANISQSINTDEFTVSFWVVLESYPSDLERPSAQVKPSSFINQRHQGEGFDIYIDTYGRWGIWLGGKQVEQQIQSNTKFPLYEWVHVGLTVSNLESTSTKQVKLFLNSQVVAEKIFDNASFSLPKVPILLAKPTIEENILNFNVNRLNGAFDQLHITSNSNYSNNIKKQYLNFKDNLPNPMASIDVPDSRFINDHLRPKLHAMPPANWTNEPHGMVKKDDTWHLFYQRTPNGPFKTQMHWGHMISQDLVNWTNIKDALRPELQSENFGFDMKGIWSGDVFLEGNVAYAFYTSVNHFDRLTSYNPGIALATSTDPLLEDWIKHGPIINTKHVKDFRDPYIWKDETLHMIIGAAYEKHGGLDYYKFNIEKNVWENQKRFSDLSYRRMDVGSIIWEMPVFEKLTDNTHILVVNPIGGAVEKYGEPATRGIYWTGEWKDGLFHPHYKDGKNLDILPGHLSPTVERGNDGFIRAIGIVDERRTSQAQEDAGWAHTFSLAREWYLMPSGTSIGQSPVQELTSLRGSLVDSNTNVLVNNEIFIGAGRQLEIELEIDPSNLPKYFGFILGTNDEKNEETLLTYDNVNNEFHVDTRRSSLNTNVFKQKRTGTIDLLM
jgi:sucrose-6-phosphate hydrolase SacC (GH32 family)